MGSYDLALIHVPSVYDFRERVFAPGPISEVVPSLYVFDMIPYGFLTLLTYLERRGFRVGIFNLAAKMLLDRSFNVPVFLKKLEADVYGIDLHWLVQAHGALEIARMVKELHPNSLVMLGGISASYYWQEIMSSWPTVDAVVRGDTAELPMAKLLKMLETGEKALKGVENLVWRDQRRVRQNSFSYFPTEMDKFEVDHRLFFKHLLRTRDLGLIAPFASFLESPIASVLTVKGCCFECETCGGSRSAYKRFMGREVLTLKSSRAIASEMASIAELARIPIFILGDIMIGGMKRAKQIIRELRKLDLENDLMFEFFNPVGRELLTELRSLGDNLYLQISPESPLEDLRNAFGRSYTNEQLERMVRNAIRLGFKRLDLYFMTGLPKQTPGNAALVSDYLEHLYGKFDLKGGLDAFTAPLAPFLDPGSNAFERPSDFGYSLLFSTLKDHRKALLEPHWRFTLNYETVWMTREEITSASRSAALSLGEVKARLGITDQERVEIIRNRVSFDAEAEKIAESVRAKGAGVGALERLRTELQELVGKKELELKRELYPSHRLIGSLRLKGLMRALLKIYLGI